MSRRLATAVLAAACLVLVSAPSVAAKPRTDARFATFNASLNRFQPGVLLTDLSDPSGDTIRLRQIRNVAEVIQRADPDVVR